MPDTTASPIDSAVTGTRTLLDAYESAIELASPQRCLTAEHIPPGELTVLGTGKAAASMALTVNELAPVALNLGEVPGQPRALISCQTV